MARVIRGLVIIFGLLLVINAVFMGIVSNFNAGTILVFVAGSALLVYGLCFVRLRKIKWLNYILISGMISLCSLLAFVAVYGRFDTVTYEEDALIILGAAIKGETPGYPLYARLEAAVAYHGLNPSAIIVVSGGQGFQEDITEALAMERHLINSGVPKDLIIKEEQATSTYENFFYAKELLDGHFDRPYRIAFVTSDFHVFRATMTAKSFGLSSTHACAPIHWYTYPTNYLRECTAIMRDFLLR